MSILKVVVDTNVIISGLLWTGAPHDIIRLAEDKRITICSSMEIVKEISEVLARGKFLSRLEILRASREELIASFLSVVEIVHPTESISAVKNDPDDNKILECAVAANANFIVSGDPHIIKLKHFRNIPILNPRKFLKECA
ncbi:MAG: putative toxin-antitoxin system toxin component, PIN family [bacterium]